MEPMATCSTFHRRGLPPQWRWLQRYHLAPSNADPFRCQLETIATRHRTTWPTSCHSSRRSSRRTQTRDTHSSSWNGPCQTLTVPNWLAPWLPYVLMFLLTASCRITPAHPPTLTLTKEPMAAPFLLMASTNSIWPASKYFSQQLYRSYASDLRNTVVYASRRTTTWTTASHPCATSATPTSTTASKPSCSNTATTATTTTQRPTTSPPLATNQPTTTTCCGRLTTRTTPPCSPSSTPPRTCPGRFSHSHARTMHPRSLQNLRPRRRTSGWILANVKKAHVHSTHTQQQHTTQDLPYIHKAYHSNHFVPSLAVVQALSRILVIWPHPQTDARQVELLATSTPSAFCPLHGRGLQTWQR